MKIKALKETFLQTIKLFPVFFVIFFFALMVSGEHQNDNPYGLGSAPNKWNPYTFKETVERIPEVLIVLLFMNIIAFPIQYEKNLHDLKKQAKCEQEEINKDSDTT